MKVSIDYIEHNNLRKHVSLNTLVERQAGFIEVRTRYDASISHIICYPDEMAVILHELPTRIDAETYQIKNSECLDLTIVGTPEKRELPDRPVKIRQESTFKTLFNISNEPVPEPLTAGGI